MEALQQKVNNLGWEVKHLDATNQKLRDQHPERAKRVDIKFELEQARGDVTQLTKELKPCETQPVELKQTLEATEKRATETTEAVAKVKERVIEANERATDTNSRADALQQETQTLKDTHASLEKELGKAKHGVEQVRVGRSQELAEQVRNREEKLASLE